MTPVSIRAVTKSYDGTTRVLDGIDLDIAAGELFFLLGGSGCGKTTLLRLVAGFIAPDAGTIRFGGQDVTRIPVEKSSAPVGSSQSRRSGSFAIARAMATRCCSPPES